VISRQLYDCACQQAFTGLLILINLQSSTEAMSHFSEHCRSPALWAEELARKYRAGEAATLCCITTFTI